LVLYVPTEDNVTNADILYAATVLLYCYMLFTLFFCRI